MRVEKIYKTNIIVSFVYFFTILITTLLTSLFGYINPNNLILRISLCFLFSFIMIFDSYTSFQKGKEYYGKTLKLSQLRVAIVLYYFYIILACTIYINETISIVNKNGSYFIALGAVLMLNVINNSIPKIEFD